MKKDDIKNIEVVHISKADMEEMLAKPSPVFPDMEIVWKAITVTLRPLGYKRNGKNDIFMRYQDVAILINLQVSAYDKKQYYINIGFFPRQIKDPVKPKFYFDSSCFGRIPVENKKVEDIVNGTLIWIEKYSEIDNIRRNLPLDKSLLNSTKTEAISFLNLQ